MPKLPINHKMIHKTKQEYVYQVLREAIMKCELEPGEKIVISDLAKQLEVSTIPVREALQLLNSEELVKYSAHTGAVVAPITKESIVEIFSIKEGLEGVAARLATEKVNQDNIYDLKEKLKKMDELVERKDFGEWGQLNSDFHMSILRLVGMPTLLNMYSNIVDKWSRIHKYYFSGMLKNDHVKSQEEHHQIVQAIIERDGNKAEKLTKVHNQNALAQYMSGLLDSQVTE